MYQRQEWSAPNARRQRRIVITRGNTTSHAGAKAPADVRAICAEMGFNPVDLSALPERKYTAANVRRLAGDVSSLLGCAASLAPEDVLLVQYPLRGQVESRLMRLLCAKAKSICLVHDMDSIRVPDRVRCPDAETLRCFDAIIVHNPVMREAVHRLAPRGSIVTLGIFDYLASSGEVSEPTYGPGPHRLYVIGNLHPMKAKYLYGAGSNGGEVVAYGPNCVVGDLRPNVTWSGVLDMHKPRLGVIDGFGLVWDGDSSQGLSGVWGDYLKVNTPHKMSLYVLLGMPVIVPRAAAMAEFVCAERIGFCVDDLEEAGRRLESCSVREWTEMIDRVALVRKRVMSGEYTRRAVSDAVSRLAAAPSVGAAAPSRLRRAGARSGR